MNKFRGRQGYSSAHFQRLANGGPDAPGAADERRRLRAAGEQAHAEALDKFGTVTPENAHEFAVWQEARIRELQAVAR